MTKTKMSGLKAPPTGLFESTNPSKGAPLTNILLDKLVPFKQHPFILYEGQRFEGMIESIKIYGVLLPIIVRPIDEIDGEITYEILSGHNRANAAKEAGLERIPAIVRDGLTEEEALLIVTESNLIQRSFNDMSHSERALVITMHYNAIKNQDRQADLIKEVENMLNTSNDGDCETDSLIGNKQTSMDRVGEEYALSKNTVARYLRVNKLTKPLKDWLEKGRFGIYAAYALSFLSDEVQHIVDDVLASSNYKLDTEKAEALRSYKKPLNHDEVEQIIAGTVKTKTKKKTSPAAFKLKSNIVSTYFSDMKPKEIETTIVAALDLYYKTQNKP